MAVFQTPRPSASDTLFEWALINRNLIPSFCHLPLQATKRSFSIFSNVLTFEWDVQVLYESVNWIVPWSRRKHCDVFVWSCVHNFFRGLGLAVHNKLLSVITSFFYQRQLNFVPFICSQVLEYEYGVKNRGGKLLRQRAYGFGILRDI